MTNTGKTKDDFKPGQNVTYIPNHAYGDRKHPDCEHGKITSINEKYVFVKFNPYSPGGQAVDPSNLV